MANIDSATLGERIREARKRAGLSQEELGRASHLERTVINKVEGGIRRVTALELSDIASAVGVRMTEFFSDPVPALVSHRSSQGLDTADSQIDRLLAKLVSDVELVASLEPKGLWDEVSAAIPSDGFPLPITAAEAEDLARTARDLMQVQAGDPVSDLTRAAARIGLFAFSRDIGTDTADAGTVLLRRGGVSLINSAMKVGRRRLALAHEIGHYLVADDYTVDWRVSGGQAHESAIESKIDRFARALLLPAVSVTTQWNDAARKFSERSAAVFLGSHFRVDMATLAARLNDLGLVGGDAAAAIRQARTTPVDMIEMDLHAPLEELSGTSVPQAFARAVLGLIHEERISKERGLDLLQGTIDEADLPKPRQRHPNEIWNYVS